MSASDLAIVAALVFAWGTLSARLERFDVTAPITFVLAGLLLTHGPLAPLGFMPSHEAVKSLAEVTLVLVLFSDASRVRLHDLRADMGLCLRLLGVGLPLTIALGTLLALALFTGMNIWLALLVGAALAPTDAALGAGMMVNQAVPARIRGLINVESGLNDGIATPFVLVAVTGAAAAERAASAGPGERLVPLVEETGALVSLLVWLAFGAVVVVPAFESLTWQTVLYAVLSLTVIRMAPVAVALAGARLGRAAVAFVGWFGPRGLASVVFALIALEDIGQPVAGSAVSVIAFTVLLSVVAHGATADPLARRYGPRLGPAAGGADDAGMPQLPARRLIRRAS